MTAPRFHADPEPLDLDRLLALTGARVAGGGGRAVSIVGLAAPDWAGPRDLALAALDSDAPALGRSHAGACVISPELAGLAPQTMLALICDDPERAFAAVAVALFPRARRPEPLYGPGVSSGASVHPEARLEADVSVDPGAVIGPGAEIGRGAVIGANVVIGAGVRIGRDGAVGPGAVISDALIGDRVTIHAGAAVGAPAVGRPSLGRAILQDDVEIGANAAIARGVVGDTVVGERTVVDMLVRIGPDCMIGRHCVIFGPASLDAGARLGDFATIGARNAERLPSQMRNPGDGAPKEDRE